MRSKDENVKRIILDFAEDYIMHDGHSPSMSTISEGTGVPRSNVQRYLVDMNQNDMLSYDGVTISTARTRKCAPAVLVAPMLGNIRCGDPSTEEANVEAYYRLPASMFGSEEAYMLVAWGDSMEDAGISEGDVLLIHPNRTPKIGSIIVAKDEKGDNTLKEYGGIDEETGKAKLLYRNRAVYGDKVILVSHLECQGVLGYCIRAYR